MLTALVKGLGLVPSAHNCELPHIARVLMPSSGLCGLLHALGEHELNRQTHTQRSLKESQMTDQIRISGNNKASNKVLICHNAL